MCILEIFDIYIFSVDVIGNIRFNVLFVCIHNCVSHVMFKQVGGIASQERFSFDLDLSSPG